MFLAESRVFRSFGKVQADSVCYARLLASQKAVSRLLSELHFSRRGLEQTPTSLSETEWAELTSLARLQRVRFALLPVVNDEPSGGGANRAAVIEQCRAIALRNLRFQAETVSLIEVLHRQGIPLLLLKGIALARTIYPAAWMREMVDVDVMVPRQQVEAAANALRSAGFTPATDLPLETSLAGHHHLPPFIRKQVPFELHWTITGHDSGLRVDTDQLWARAERISFGPVHAWTLCPEDVLLHLCIHAAHQYGFEMGLRPLCDLSALVSARPAIDWDAVVDRAHAWGAARGTYLTLALAARLLGVPVPRAALARLRADDAADDITALAIEHLFSAADDPVTFPPQLSRLFAAQSMWHRLRYLAGRVVLPWEVMAVNYGLPLDTAWHRRLRYLLLRAGSLARRHAPGVWALWLGSDGRSRVRMTRQNAIGAWLAVRD